MRAGLAGFVAGFLVWTSVASADVPTDFSGVDRDLAAAVRSGSVTRDVGLPAAATDDIALENRDLLVQALAVLEPARRDVPSMTAKQADLLLSVLATIRSSRNREEAEGGGQDLEAVARAVWEVYVAPLRADAKRSGMVGLTEPSSVPIRRWFETGQAGKVVVAELHADPETMRLRWGFADVRAASGGALAVIRRQIETEPDAVRTARRMVLYLETSNVSTAAARSEVAWVEPGDRLQVRIEDSRAATAECLAKSGAKSIIDVPRPKEGAALRGSTAQPDKGAADRAAAEAACAARNKPLAGAVDRAILVDVRRQATIFERALGTDADVAAAVALARSLAKDWP
jgi:hypothetical protein